VEFPDDKNVAGNDDEFLFGSDLLVAPVLTEGATTRDVYLPRGEWFDYWTGKSYSGGKSVSLPVTIDSIPMFVRGGGFIFRQPIVQDTDEMPGKALRVLISPAVQSEATHYEDDGETPDYRKGNFMTRKFQETRDDKETRVLISAPEGKYRPAARDIIIETRLGHAPQSVHLGITDVSNPLSRLTPEVFDKAASGWTFSDGLLQAKTSDVFQPMLFEIIP
jgi:alpha-glucosidase (family GH31 glycosyl hydrolase)